MLLAADLSSLGFILLTKLYHLVRLPLECTSMHPFMFSLLHTCYADAVTATCASAPELTASRKMHRTRQS